MKNFSFKEFLCRSGRFFVSNEFIQVNELPLYSGTNSKIKAVKIFFQTESNRSFEGLVDIEKLWAKCGDAQLNAQETYYRSDYQEIPVYKTEVFTLKAFMVSNPGIFSKKSYEDTDNPFDYSIEFVISSKNNYSYSFELLNLVKLNEFLEETYFRTNK
jgi:hypothetical protein